MSLFKISNPNVFLCDGMEFVMDFWRSRWQKKPPKGHTGTIYMCDQKLSSCVSFWRLFKCVFIICNFGNKCCSLSVSLRCHLNGLMHQGVNDSVSERHKSLGNCRTQKKKCMEFERKQSTFNACRSLHWISHQTINVLSQY